MTRTPSPPPTASPDPVATQNPPTGQHETPEGRMDRNWNTRDDKTFAAFRPRQHLPLCPHARPA